MIRANGLREHVTVYGVHDTGSASGDVFGSGEDVDRYGNPIQSETDGIEVPAAVAPLAVTEDEINRDTRISRYTVTMRPDAPIDGRSKVEWLGRDFDVIGEPELHTDRNGPHHVELTIREILG